MNFFKTLLSKARLWWNARGKQKLLKISKDAWSIAYGHVKAVDRLTISDAAKLDAVQNAICEEVSPLVGYDIHPGELTKRLAQACHWQFRVAQMLGIEPKTIPNTDADTEILASLDAGHLAAKSVAAHLLDMGGGRAEIPVTLDGKNFLIIATRI